MSNIINKVKDALHSDHHTSTGTTGNTTHTGHTTTSGTAEGVAGPHNSRLGNAADPRVDSDLDGSRNAGAGVGTGTGHTHTVGSTGLGSGSGNFGTGSSTAGTGFNSGSTGSGVGYDGAGNTGVAHHHTTAGTGAGTGVGSGTSAGPHSSNVLNKLDPRVDATTGQHSIGQNSGTTGTGHSSGTTGTGYSSGTTGTGHSSGTTGTGVTGSNYPSTGTHGGISSSTNAGPHDSNLANKLDPRVDSDLDGRGNRQQASKTGILGASGSHATPGSGTSQNTAGPHNSDTMNKLDPRVDSDRDGSGTVGGNMTHA